MVSRILRTLHREISGLHEAAYLLGSFALLSQVLALVRDRLLAHTFGAGAVLDVYYAAFRVPDVIFASVASLVSFSILIPFLAERLARDKEEARRFMDNIFSLFLLCMIAVTAVIFFLAPFLAPRLFPGFSLTVVRDELVPLMRVMLLSPILLGLSSHFATITQVYRKFFLYAVSPLLYNIGIIAGVVFFYPLFGFLGLGYGVVLGALLHFAVQLPFIVKESNFLPRFRFHINVREVRDVVLLALPRTLALSAQQIALLVLFSLASLLGEGSVAVFSLALNLQSVPLSVIGTSYSVAAFPTLARLFSNGEKKEFFDHMVLAIRHVIFWSLPALVLFIILRAQIVRVIYGSGRFSWTDTRLTAASLALFAFSLVAQNLILLFVRGYYAAGKTKKPLVVTVGASLVTVGSAFLLLHLFASFSLFRYFMESLFEVDGLVGTSVLMLPLSYSIGSLCALGAFLILFQRDFAAFSSRIGTALFQSFAASVVMGFVAHLFLRALSPFLNMHTVLGVFLQGLLAGIGGILAGVIVLAVLKNEELHEIAKSLRRKFWRASVIVPEERGL